MSAIRPWGRALSGKVQSNLTVWNIGNKESSSISPPDDVTFRYIAHHACYLYSQASTGYTDRNLHIIPLYIIEI
jgi:hypothetical protein